MCTLMRNSFWTRMLGHVRNKFVYYSSARTFKLVREIVDLSNVNRRDGPIAMQNVEIANKVSSKGGEYGR